MVTISAPILKQFRGSVHQGVGDDLKPRVGSKALAQAVLSLWMVVKIMVPNWVPEILGAELY